jgi:translation elongation factor EF-Tu-like GTPase
MLGHEPDIEAEITFLTPDEGGRQTAVFSGYRGQFYYRGEDHDAIQEYLDAKRVHPGETATAQLHFLHPELFIDRIGAGDDFEIREGLRVVARGRVTHILNLLDNAGATQRIGREAR